MTSPIEPLTEYEVTALAAFVRAHLDPPAHRRLQPEMPSTYAKLVGRPTEATMPRISLAKPTNETCIEQEDVEWFARGEGEPTLMGICPPIGLAPVRSMEQGPPQFAAAEHVRRVSCAARRPPR